MKAQTVIKCNSAACACVPLSQSSDRTFTVNNDPCGCQPYTSVVNAIIDASGVTGPVCGHSAAFSNVNTNACILVPTAGVAVNAQHIGVVNNEQECCAGFPWTYGVLYRSDGNVFVDGSPVAAYTIAAMTFGNEYMVRFNPGTYSIDFLENGVVLLNHVLATVTSYKFWNTPTNDGVNRFTVNPIT